MAMKQDWNWGGLPPSPRAIPVSLLSPPEASVPKPEAARELFSKWFLSQIGLVPGLGARVNDQWPSGGFGVEGWRGCCSRAGVTAASFISLCKGPVVQRSSSCPGAYPGRAPFGRTTCSGECALD